ncbi:MAG: host attachment protein [Gammaproteobacteria bacterium]|nr:host attachment protein [Gammaproteobacteria bacterium]MDH5730051.1 host attachment protein [Gammaproteobacteria bacterium]
MNQKWYVIANSAQAKIYYTDNNKTELTLHETLDHPESRMKAAEISSDRPGHFQAAGGISHGSFAEKTNPKDYEVERFANEVASYLNNARNQNVYYGLIIAASPKFHGLLNKHMNKNVAELVNKHIEKDLSSVPVHQLTDTVNQYLRA